MEKTFRIIFVDDDRRYADSLQDRAFSEFGLELEHYDNWEEAFTKLEEDFDAYHGVIIDGKGKLSKDSKDDDQRHVNKAIGDLREQKGRGRYIPYVVLSKYLEIKDTITERFFEKGREEDKMFRFIIDEITSLEENKLKAKYHDAFQSFGDNYLNKEAEDNMLEALRSFETNNWSASTFTPLRKIIEAVYQSLHDKDDKLIPHSCLRFENGKINFTLCERRLKGQEINERTGRVAHPAGNKVLSVYLNATITHFTRLCNNSMHIAYRDKLTKNTLGACIYFIIDLLIWYKIFVDEKYSY